LPSEIEHFVSLVELDLNSNELTSLPRGLTQLHHITTLNVSYNSLRYLPDWIGELTSLLDLSVSSNELTQLPDTIGRLAQKQVDVFACLDPAALLNSDT
jgi:Leucine-rich repeat (LRR) protein